MNTTTTHLVLDRVPKSTSAPLSRARKISGAASGLLMLTLCAAMQLRAADKSQPKPADVASKPGSKAPVPAKSTIQTRAEKIILPKVQFQGASLDEALEFLRIQSKNLDPEKKGINIIAGKSKAAGGEQISLNLHDVPLSECLNYVAQLSGMELKFDDHAAMLTAQKKEQPALKPVPAAALERHKTAIETRAEKLILPAVSFQDASAEECIDFLRVKSASLRNNDGDSLAVNIVLNVPKNTELPKITLNLRDVPLSEVLKYVAGLAGLELTADESSFLLKPLIK